MGRRLSGNGGGGSLRAVTRTLLVSSATGVIAQVSASLKAPVAWAKTGGDANLTISSGGAISAAAAIAAGASQTLNATATGADGCVQPWALTLSGIIPSFSDLLIAYATGAM